MPERLPSDAGAHRSVPETKSGSGRFAGLLRDLPPSRSRDDEPASASDTGETTMKDVESPLRGRIAVAAAAMLALVLAGVLWLGVSFEMLRTEVAGLSRAVREAPAAPQPTAGPDLAPDIAALREAVAGLSAKVDRLAAGDEAKAVSRLAAEIKTLTARVEALAAAKAAPAKPAASREDRSAPPPRQTAPAPRPIIDPDQSTPPFYGPGYPAWPGY